MRNLKVHSTGTLESGIRRRPVALFAYAVVVLLALFGLEYLIVRGARQYESLVYMSDAEAQVQQQAASKGKESAVKAATADPLNGYARYFIGTSYLLLNDDRNAIEAFRRAGEFMPHIPNVLRLLTQCLFSLKDFKAAADAADRYFAMDPSPKVTPENLLRIRALALERSMEFGRACIALTDADVSPMFRTEIAQFRVANAIVMNNITLTDYLYRRLRFYFPKEGIEPAAILSECLAAGKIPMLLRFIEILRLRGEVDASMLKALALAYTKMGRYDEAQTIYNEARTIAPQDPEVYLLYGDLQYHRGDMKQAKELYDTYLQIAPHSPLRVEIQTKLANPPSTTESLTRVSSPGAAETSTPAAKPAP